MAAQDLPVTRSDAGVWRWIGGFALVVVILLYGFPLYWMVSTSFKTLEEIGTLTWIPSGFDFTPYAEFLRTDFLPALRNSVQISGLTMVVSLALAIPASYGLTGVKSRLLTPILLLILLVQLIPTSAMFIPLFQLLNQLNLINTKFGVALALSTLMVPFAILVLRPAFASIPESLEEAAAVDGASGGRYLWRIAIPLLRNSIFVTGAVIFVGSWAELLYPLTFLLDSTNHPLSVYIAQAAGRFNNTWNILMAVSVLASMPVLLVVLGAQNQLRRGLTIGAVK